MQADAAAATAAAIAIDTQTCKAGGGGRGGSRSIKTKSELESQSKRHYRVLATTPPNAAKPFICLSARSKTSARGVARGGEGTRSTTAAIFARQQNIQMKIYVCIMNFYIVLLLRRHFYVPVCVCVCMCVSVCQSTPHTLA